MSLKTNVSLKDHSNYKIGGESKYFAEFHSRDELTEALSEYKKIDPELKSVFILGTGTNVLFRDEGYDGLVLKNAIMGVSKGFNEVSVFSGTLMEELVEFAVSNSLSGFEWAGGLPGSVGGAIRGNAGAFGGEIKDNLVEVVSINMHSLKTIVRNNSQCAFGYRQSVFKREEGKDEVIFSSKFRVKTGNQEEIKQNTQKQIDYRVAKHPLEYPNIGSTFKNIPVDLVPKDVLEEFKNYVKNDPFPVLPVAKLIAVMGLMGRRVGDAQISEKHPNFIVNLGEASAADVRELVSLVKKEMEDKYKISLEEEIMIL